MTNQVILERITEIILENPSNDDIVLTAEAEGNDVSGWDGLAHVRVMVAVEEAL